MASLADLYVGLKVNASGFVSGLNSAKSSLSSFGAHAEKIAKASAFAVAGLATGAAAGISALAKESMSAIDSTAKLADTIGINTEMLVAFRHAAELTGAGAQLLDDSLSKMVKNVGEAAQGGGAAAGAFTQLGLSISSLARMAPDQQFSAISDSLNKIENSSIKNAIATDIFGKSGQKLINMLSLGSDGLAQMSTEAERLGITFNRVDAAKIEMANDSITRLGTAFTGLGNQVAIAVSPYLTEMANQLTELGQLNKGFGSGLAGAFKESGYYAALLIDELTAIKAGLYGIGAIAAGGFSAHQKLYREASNVAYGWGRMLGITSEADEIRNRNAQRSGTVSTQLWNAGQEAWNQYQRGSAFNGFSNFVTRAEGNAQSAAEKVAAQSAANRMANANSLVPVKLPDFSSLGKMGSSVFGLAKSAWGGFEKSQREMGEKAVGSIFNMIGGIWKETSKGLAHGMGEIAKFGEGQKQYELTPESTTPQHWGTWAGGALPQAMPVSNEVKMTLKELQKQTKVLNQILEKNTEATFA